MPHIACDHPALLLFNSFRGDAHQAKKDYLLPTVHHIYIGRREADAAETPATVLFTDDMCGWKVDPEHNLVEGMKLDGEKEKRSRMGIRTVKSQSLQETRVETAPEWPQSGSHGPFIQNTAHAHERIYHDEENWVNGCPKSFFDTDTPCRCETEPADELRTFKRQCSIERGSRLSALPLQNPGALESTCDRSHLNWSEIFSL